MVTVELLPDSALVALRRFCAIQMAVIIIIIISKSICKARLNSVNLYQTRLLSYAHGYAKSSILQPAMYLDTVIEPAVRTEMFIFSLPKCTDFSVKL